MAGVCDLASLNSTLLHRNAYHVPAPACLVKYAVPTPSPRASLNATHPNPWMLFSDHAIKYSARYLSNLLVIKWHICLVAVTIQGEQTMTYEERTLPMRNSQL